MRKFFAVALGSMVALAGFAGVASASATVDLVWIDVSGTDTAGNPICLRPAKRNCPQLGSTIQSIGVTDSITLGVLITAGPGSILTAGVDVDYRSAQPKLSVGGFQAFSTTRPLVYLPLLLFDPPNNFVDGWVQFLGAGSQPFQGLGIGLSPGASAYLGTVTFHKDELINGTFEIAVGTDGPDGISGVIKLDGGDISGITTYNGAFLLNVPEPGALSLLVMGLGGMLLAGRGRRS